MDAEMMKIPCQHTIRQDRKWLNQVTGKYTHVKKNEEEEERTTKICYRYGWPMEIAERPCGRNHLKSS